MRLNQKKKYPAMAAEAGQPPELPRGLRSYRRAYRNWSGVINTGEFWYCAPRDAEDVIALANWAHRHSWGLRASGYQHTWAPLTVGCDRGAEGPRVLLLDTRRHLTAIEPAGPDTTRVQPGATMGEFLGHLQQRGLGLISCPSTGQVTVGGVLAIGGHGSAVPAHGETALPGHGYGSLSNQVTALTAVVWDEDSGCYVLRTFTRSDPDCAALLTNLGRIFLVEVVLRAGPEQPLRCVSRMDITADELFSASNAGSGRTFADFVELTGRAEAIWFAFTKHPWLKTWSISPHQPTGAWKVSNPYNYPLSDRLPEPLARLIARIVVSRGRFAPWWGRFQLMFHWAGLQGFPPVVPSRWDLWGPSRHLLHYLRPTTLRVTTAGYAVLMERADLQWAISRFAAHYRSLLDAYRRRGAYPVTCGVELRVSGLDGPDTCAVPGARPPLLSPLSPRPDRPEWDTALWLAIFTFPESSGHQGFFRDLEQRLLATFDDTRAALRVEWAKAWAFNGEAPWTDPHVLGHTIPTGFPINAESRQSPWNEAVDILDRLDPHRVFGNPLLDKLLIVHASG